MTDSRFQIKNLGLPVIELLCALIFFGGAVSGVPAQSTSIDFPTAVSSNVIDGKIAARDLGDARLTSFYYTFEGVQGDIFINVAASNFNGDIDVFTADGLRPLTKITLFADTNSPSETGRVIYLRKPEKIILRVEGRTPDDNPGTYRIKFAGSFVAVQGDTESIEPKLPELKSVDDNEIRVTSVGTIIKVEPKPTPLPPSILTEEKIESVTAAEAESKPLIPPPSVKAKRATRKTTLPKVIVTDNSELPKANASDNESKVKKPTANKTVAKTTRAKSKLPLPEKTKPVVEGAPDPLENIHLVVLMKDGEKIDLPMSEVFRFSLNNGVLTIIKKDGKIERRAFLDIQKMTVE